MRLTTSEKCQLPESSRRTCDELIQLPTPHTYDEDGTPISSGLMDPRLGTVEPGQRCRTCGNRVGECPGHFGHIELARPVMHVGYAKHAHKLLQAVCRSCSRLLLSPEKLQDFQEKLIVFPERIL